MKLFPRHTRLQAALACLIVAQAGQATAAAPVGPAASTAATEKAASAPSQPARGRQGHLRMPRAVAIDTGPAPAGTAGQTMHNMNVQLADALAGALLQRQVPVLRIPAGLAPARRAEAAAGAALVVLVNHEPASLAATGKATQATGYALTLAQQPRAQGPVALDCARHAAVALTAGGRRHNGVLAPGRQWADTALGVQRQADLVLLNQAPVPALRLQAAALANPTEQRLVQDKAWLRAQARRVAEALVTCLKPPPLAYENMARQPAPATPARPVPRPAARPLLLATLPPPGPH